MGVLYKSPVGDAQLLFGAFRRSTWRHLEVRVDGMQLTISRLDIRDQISPNALADDQEPSDLATSETILTAPHVANLEYLAPIGSTLAAKEVFAIINILDERIELRAPTKMKIVEHLSSRSDLLEHGSPLVRSRLPVSG